MPDFTDVREHKRKLYVTIEPAEVEDILRQYVESLPRYRQLLAEMPTDASIDVSITDNAYHRSTTYTMAVTAKWQTVKED